MSASFYDDERTDDKAIFSQISWFVKKSCQPEQYLLK